MRRTGGTAQGRLWDRNAGKKRAFFLRLSPNMKRAGYLTLSSCAFPGPGDGKLCSKSSSRPASTSWWGKIFLQQFLYHKFVYSVYKQ